MSPATSRDVTGRDAADFGVVDERSARIAWSRLAEPESVMDRGLVAEHGFVGAVDHVLHRGDEPVFYPGMTEPVRPIDRFGGRLVTLDVERERQILRPLQARVVIPEDQEWPAGLDDLTLPPWALWVRGPARLDEWCETAVAVVGARACTSYGAFMATELAGGLAARGFTIVSGAAYGIDAAAHRAALAAQGRTIAVLAGGVDRLYPSANHDLLQRLARDHLVVTESPPGCAPARWRFLSRNRLIAAMSRGTLLVEAGLRSGARNTVKHAIDLNRPVGAVPGPVTSMVSAGCHLEIRDHRAELVTDAAEAAELFGGLGEHLATPKRGEVRLGDGAGEVPSRVFAALAPHHSATVDELGVVAGLGPREVLAALGELQSAGLVEHLLDGWARVRRSP